MVGSSLRLSLCLCMCPISLYTCYCLPLQWAAAVPYKHNVSMPSAVCHPLGHLPDHMLIVVDFWASDWLISSTCFILNIKRLTWCESQHPPMEWGCTQESKVQWCPKGDFSSSACSKSSGFSWPSSPFISSQCFWHTATQGVSERVLQPQQCSTSHPVMSTFPASLCFSSNILSGLIWTRQRIRRNKMPKHVECFLLTTARHLIKSCRATCSPFGLNACSKVVVYKIFRRGLTSHGATPKMVLSSAVNYNFNDPQPARPQRICWLAGNNSGTGTQTQSTTPGRN